MRNIKHSFDDFINILSTTQEELKLGLETLMRRKYGKDKVEVGDGFLYAEGTHPVLLVAHLDTVHKCPPYDICISEDKRYIMSPYGIGGDDRCGVYIILRLLETLNCSVLFCEDEEIGAIGAQKFGSSGINVGKIKYIAEFDRKGRDEMVFYKTTNQDFVDFLAGFGWKENIGTMSDISYLAEDLMLEAVNFSAGYYNQHSVGEYIDMNDVEEIIERARATISADAPFFEYVQESKTSYKSYSHSGGYYYCDYLSPAKYTIYVNGEQQPFKSCYIYTNGKIWIDGAWFDSKTNSIYVIDNKTGVVVFEGDDALFEDSKSAKTLSYYDLDDDYDDI